MIAIAQLYIHYFQNDSDTIVGYIKKATDYVLANTEGGIGFQFISTINDSLYHLIYY